MIARSTTFNKVAEALLMDYSSIYYVNIRTNEYQWYSFDPQFRSLRIEKEGEDFFANMVRDAKQVVYEEDQPIFTEQLTKDNLLQQLKEGGMRSIEYRLMIDGEPVYHTIRLIREEIDNEDYFILGVLNVDKDVRERKAAERAARERKAFNQIAASLAGRYDVLYYVEMNSGVYTEFMSGEIYGDGEIREEGNDFFTESQRNARQIVYPEDQERLMGLLNRDYLITKLEDRKQFSADYRLMVDGKARHTRLTVMWSQDEEHFIIGVENIEEEIRREQEQSRVLKLANEMARRDDLTGAKNRNAFREFLNALQRSIDHGAKVPPFAIVVCDLNDLKLVNDEQGHKAGDEQLRKACQQICYVFGHSPVFRIGGDEFAAVLMEVDYENRYALMDDMQHRALTNQLRGEGPVVASGIAARDPARHPKVDDVFEEADQAMYEDKERLKNIREAQQAQAKAGAGAGSDGGAGAWFGEPAPEMAAYELIPDRVVPDFRRRRLDQLFESLSVVSDTTYLFLCDMWYDYSRWSKTAVDYFGLPDEYMLHAGSIWEGHIHPEDRPAYRQGVDQIFSDQTDRHDMQYRARRPDGEYDLCTCRGTVLRDENGEAEYFLGSIRNHGVLAHVDATTGLRNQYAFLEDLNLVLERRTPVQVWMVGISRFSELNDVYGYHFGNRLLQHFGRHLYGHVGNRGSVYRLDGTKFAVIYSDVSEEDIRAGYADLRAYFRDGFYMDDHYIILETNAGLLSLESFDIDERTVYSCLSFAYSISKGEKRGDLVRFVNELNDENNERIEKIQAIRASIPLGMQGFFLTYQPLVDTRTEKLIGAEALLRWQGDKYGLVPPDDFIPVLEQDSLFPELGRWILYTALTEVKQILDRYPDLVLDVNLSYTQIEQSGFADDVLQILRETGFPPANLCLEITERCRLLDLELLNNVVEKLRAAGVHFALDDFGTGYASIGIMKNLHIDMIKIDREFIRNIEEDVRERKVIATFTEAAAVYGSDVCVEGVENGSMRDILRRYPVRCFQGYYYARPMRWEDFVSWDEKREDQGQ